MAVKASHGSFQIYSWPPKREPIKGSAIDDRDHARCLVLFVIRFLTIMHQSTMSRVENHQVAELLRPGMKQILDMTDELDRLEQRSASSLLNERETINNLFSNYSLFSSDFGTLKKLVLNNPFLFKIDDADCISQDHNSPMLFQRVHVKFGETTMPWLMQYRIESLRLRVSSNEVWVGIISELAWVALNRTIERMNQSYSHEPLLTGLSIGSYKDYAKPRRLCECVLI